jgi:hypothetical protein
MVMSPDATTASLKAILVWVKPPGLRINPLNRNQPIRGSYQSSNLHDSIGKYPFSISIDFALATTISSI